jgi:hypothetical protein
MVKKTVCTFTKNKIILNLSKNVGKNKTFSPFSFVVVVGSGIRDERKIESRINIRDPQHCYQV